MLVERMGKKVVVLKRNGIKLKNVINRQLVDRFMKYVKKSTDCWEWIGVKNYKGYGRFSIYEKPISAGGHAHRFSYMIFKGNIPDCMTVHHKCENKSCVNPDHLELMTEKENRKLSGCWSAVNSRKTHCKNGHEFTKENIYYHFRNGSIRRHCKICRLEARKKWTNKEKLWKSN
jgi:hypothetical protein